MSGDKREIIIGFVVIVVIAAGIFFWRRSKTNLKVPEATPGTSIQNEIESRFNLQIPENVEKAELKDTTGGDSMGVATRKYENGKFVFTVLANLPELAGSEFYEGWLTKGKSGDNDYSVISAGKLRIAKGGYLLEFQSSTDYSGYNSTTVTEERVNDNMPEKTVLEGSF
jgi:hypothetical protein